MSSRSKRNRLPVKYTDELSDVDSSIDFIPKKVRREDSADDSGTGSSSDDGDDEPETFSGAPWENAQLSEYERMILKKIDARNKFMIESGFPEAVRDLNACLPSNPPKPEKSCRKPAKKKSVTKKESPLPRREPSRRLQNMAAKTEEDVKKELEEEDDKENAEGVDDRMLESAEMNEDMNSVLNYLNEPVDYKPDLNLVQCNVNEYRDQLLSLQLLQKGKFLPGRIQSMLTHPQTSKTILFAGDKYGNFGVWAPLEGERDPTIHRVHRAPLNCISVSKDNISKVYTTGHDGVIVQTDFSAGKFITVFATDWSEKITHLTWHDEFEDKKILVAHGRGDVGVLDSRAGKEIQNWVDCFAKSVRTVQHHPVQRNYFLAASGYTGSYKIFDLRRSDECICEMEHDKGLTSAFFSPGGTRIVTTCNDDHINVYDSTVLTSTMPRVASYLHNNFTGRWLTSFRANWVPQRDDVFHVGSLLKPRRIQFYKADNGGKLCEVAHDEVDTVCCVIAMHPTLPVFAGANSSGKTYFFGPSHLTDTPAL